MAMMVAKDPMARNRPIQKCQMTANIRRVYALRCPAHEARRTLGHEDRQEGRFDTSR